MARLTINLDGKLAGLVSASTPEELDALISSGHLIRLSDGAEIIISGLEGGMASGAPSVALGFKLPDGRVVVAETSWRLFATAFHALAGKFGTPYPDMTEMEILRDTGPTPSYKIVADDTPRYAECQGCGERVDFPPESEATQPMEPMWWLYDHFRSRHPEVEPQGVPRCGTAYGAAAHSIEPVREGHPLADKFSRICTVCGEAVR